jgi:hypothetical protein
LTDPASGAYATRLGSTDPGAGGSGEAQLVTGPRPAPGAQGSKLVNVLAHER